jgi:uncharacterized SAM-binding protein YcdF (DUF218 family)
MGKAASFWLSAIGWLVFGVLVIWLGTIGLIIAAGARPALRRADAIIVLGAAQYNGRPSPVLQARLDHAISLFKRGLAQKLVVTGGVGRGDTVSEGEVARRYAESKGIPSAAIMVDKKGVTSAESMSAAASLLKANKRATAPTALIVSDSYHMLRLEVLALKSGIQPYRAPAKTPTDKSRRHWRYVLRESVLVPGTALLGAK